VSVRAGAGALAAAAALGLAACGSSGTPGLEAEACPGHPAATGTSDARPGPALTAALAVLRRPATAADALPASIIDFADRHAQLLVHAARRALVAGGTTYWIVPDIAQNPRTCRNGPAVAFVTADRQTTGLSLSPGVTLAWIDAERPIQTTGRAGRATTIQMVVPSAVGSVTLSYRHATVIAHPEGNVLAVTVALGQSAAVHPMTATWRSRLGSVIRVVRGTV
jgi:hypothetical protein